jgi:hypothetical protein
MKLSTNTSDSGVDCKIANFRRKEDTENSTGEFKIFDFFVI